ncbi:MAG: hypothetical protein RR246_00920 [Clostridia bacterium]
MIGKRKFAPKKQGENRFYYPISGKPLILTDVRMQSDIPYSVGNDLLKSDFDPNGSYTGIPSDNVLPTQDADDL